MWLLPLLGYLGILVGFCFMTLSIASGLYYLSEIVEEHTVLTKKLLTRTIYAVMAAQLLLCAVDAFPVSTSLLSVASHAVYLRNLRRFPIVKLTDPVFLLSCVLVLLNHYLWFLHFSSLSLAPPSPRHASSSSYPYRRASAYDASPYDYAAQPSFGEIAAFFGLCVWLVPFALFVSLSAGENVLPSTTDGYAGAARADGVGGVGMSGPRAPGKVGMAKAVVDGVRNWAAEVGNVVGLGGGSARRDF